MDELFQEEESIIVSTGSQKLITRRGYEDLKQELARHQQEKSEYLIRLEEARSHGDLSENAEYTEAKEGLRNQESMINEITMTLSMCQPVDHIEPKNTADFGAEVTLEIKNQDNISQKIYVMVGEGEGDMFSSNRIAINSPLGKLLIGKSINSTFSFNNKQYKVLSIVYDDKNILPISK